MKEYNLVNKTTLEAFICNKVEVEGFDYYVSKTNNHLKPDDKYKTIIENRRRIVEYSKHIQSTDKLIIATNCPHNTDIPKIILEVDEFADSTLNKLYKNGYIDEDQIPYAKTRIKQGYNKSQETHPFSEKDMVEFLDYVKQKADRDYLNSEQLLLSFKDQQIKTIYYANI